MSKTNFERTAKNQTLNDPKNNKRRGGREHFSFAVDVSPHDKTRLQKYFQSELAYFNYIGENLASRVRTSPESLTMLSGDLEELVGLLAFSGFNIDSIAVKTKDIVLPDVLQKYSDLLLGRDSSGKRKLDDKLCVTLSSFTGNTGVHPQIRKNMALEMLRFYRDQAKIFSQGIPASMRNEFSYRTAPQSIELGDSIKKRHIQLPRELVKVEWNAKEEQTEIRTPYTSQPIIIENINLNDMGQWNIMIIHQTPGSIPDNKTPWVLDFFKTQNLYKTNYYDVINPRAGSSFAIAKKKSFAHSVD